MVSAYLSVFFSTSTLTSLQYLVLINRQQFSNNTTPPG